MTGDNTTNWDHLRIYPRLWNTHGFLSKRNTYDGEYDCVEYITAFEQPMASSPNSTQMTGECDYDIQCIIFWDECIGYTMM